MSRSGSGVKGLDARRVNVAWARVLLVALLCHCGESGSPRVPTSASASHSAKAPKTGTPFSVPPPWLTALIRQITEVLPAASVTPSVDGASPAAVVRWSSMRVRLPITTGLLGFELAHGPHAMEAMAFVDELARAGVVLERTLEHLATSHGTWLSCKDEQDARASTIVCREERAPVVEATSSLASVGPRDLPPSMRTARADHSPVFRTAPRRAASASPTADAIARVFAAHPGLRLSGMHLSNGPHILHVEGNDMGTRAGVLLCLSAGEAADVEWECAASSIGRILNAASTTRDGWLVFATSPEGPRDRSSSLVSLRKTRHGLELDGLELGGVTCDGQACEPPHDGYCVSCEGSWSTVWQWEMDCVERRPGGSWQARSRATYAHVDQRTSRTSEWLCRSIPDPRRAFRARGLRAAHGRAAMR